MKVFVMKQLLRWSFVLCALTVSADEALGKAARRIPHEGQFKFSCPFKGSLGSCQQVTYYIVAPQHMGQRQTCQIRAQCPDASGTLQSAVVSWKIGYTGIHVQANSNGTLTES